MTSLARLPVLLLTLVVTACDRDTAPEAVYDDRFSAPAYLVEHGRYFEEGTVRIGDAPVWLYANSGGGFANTVVIEGDDGLIVVDTNLNQDDAEITAARLRERSDKPVVAVVYTHHHADHVSGTAAFIDPEQARSGEVKVIAAENFLREMSDENSVTGPLMAVRAMYMYGALLDPDTDGRHFHSGCCGRFRRGRVGYIEPNTFVGDDTTMTLAGVRMRLFRTGGEAASHIAVYLPEWRIMLSGDEVQGPTFPNLHSLRGTKPRDIEAWIAALDRMRREDIEWLVPSHGRPVAGRQQVEELLTTYRDAIQWTHDQAVRLINRGYTQQELAEALDALPAELDLEPWTREMYGTVKHSVRNIFTGYSSWWDGDPATLDPTPRREQARRTVALMGGRDRVFAAAQEAIDGGDPQWSAELLTLLIRIDREDRQARELKARALRQLGYATANTNWRGFYLTGARELEGRVDSLAIQRSVRESFDFANASTRFLFDLLRYRVLPDRAAGKHIVLEYRLPDVDETWSLTLRRQVLEVRPGPAAEPDAVVSLDRALLDDIMQGSASYARELLPGGGVDIDGSRASFLDFYASLDLEPAPIELLLR
jgi:alkyl sulfatase BDS1-like metallo-beta-lactamase superfamily hydrolase